MNDRTNDQTDNSIVDRITAAADGVGFVVLGDASDMSVEIAEGRESKYQNAADSFLARGQNESVEDFTARKAGTVAIADALDCGVWHASFLWTRRNVTRPRCYLCGGTMKDDQQPAHALCEARTNRGRSPLPVVNYDPGCGCNWELCEYPAR